MIWFDPLNGKNPLKHFWKPPLGKGGVTKSNEFSEKFKKGGGSMGLFQSKHLYCIFETLNRAFWAGNWFKRVISGFRVSFFNNCIEKNQNKTHFEEGSSSHTSLRDRPGYQNGWMSGKVPNGSWLPPPAPQNGPYLWKSCACISYYLALIPPCIYATIFIIKNCNIIFQKWGWGVKGRLEFFQKFIRTLLLRQMKNSTLLRVGYSVFIKVCDVLYVPPYTSPYGENVPIN